MPTILHAGCGTTPLPEWLGGTEVRLDIDPRCKPDIVASLTDMGDIGPFDVVFSCHCLEHLYSHDVPKALAEFMRVLRPGGAAVIVVPDLENIRPTEEVMYESPAGPITGLDMFFGHRGMVERSPYMAHKCGFIRSTLEGALKTAGFEPVKMDNLSPFDLVGIGTRP
jgi:SAM-dependent methyltransferase